MSTITRKRGDDASDLRYRLRGHDESGALQYQSLAGVHSVTAHVKKGSTTSSITATAEEANPSEWWVRVAAADLAALAMGRYRMETEVVFADGTRKTFPNGANGQPKYDTLIIEQDLADAPGP